MSQIQQTLRASAPQEAQRGRQNPRVSSRTRPTEVGVSAPSWIFRRITREVSLVVLAIFSFAPSLVAQPYTPPANERVDVILDPGWRFIRQDVTGAQNSSFDDSAWSVINLPHTWNNLDGQDGGKNYYRGIGWYRVHCAVDGSYTNRHFFLKFDGAFLVTDVYLNGNYLGEHQGGFAAFVFDATPYIQVGGDNVIAVKVNNAFNANLPPLNADFTFFGGLYRDVHLLVTDPVQISPLDYASLGVYLTTTSVSSSSANLQVTTVVSNSTASAQTVTVRVVVTDAATNIVTTLTNVVTLQASSVSNVVAGAVIANPHLWNGLTDPYLYQTFVEVWNGASAVDVVAQLLGFRYFSVDPTNGFFLNGRHYDLHGVNMHQDWLNCGWALTNAQRDTNFIFLKEIGATFLRLSHYEHNDYTYQLADRNGICVWSEVPIIDYLTESPAFYTNSLQQLREMIRQRYNHPSVVCWSVYNEITLQAGPTPTNLISQEVQLVSQEDSTRPSTAAANTSDNDPSTLYTQLIAFNKYYGWYSSPLNGVGSWADNIHANYPKRCIGVSEYGAGASIYQHSENPTFPANTASSFHPEEWQDIVHETNWQLMAARPFLWCKLVWNEFDFASDGRNEGDTPGRNDKGLVTYDRLVRKDAFYYYKANWTTNPMVYITGHTFTNRLTNAIIAKVYANCDSVELFLNGNSQGVVISTNCIYTWPVTLLPGTNTVQAVGTKGSTNVTDSLIWIALVTPPLISVITPVGAVAYLNTTNDTLQLSVSVTNPVPANTLTTAWSQLSGPGAITFGNSSALTTAANFSSNGMYSLDFTANNGGNTTVPFTVVVGSGGAITNGLLAWWKMNETGGSTAADSSGNGRTATISGAVFTNFATGYPSNALHFNGSSSYASFSSPGVTQLTLVAWARANAQGNSAYPRIFDTPGYRLFFRFDSQGNNGFDFATYSTGNGDWFSGANTISPGAWYHIAASYGLSSLTNVPAEYVNGVPIAAPTVITTPSGTQPSSAGTGYIGNVAALTRGWSGDLSDLRIYNRLLSGTEVQILANAPSINCAPSVNAGSNQTIIWPAAANLAGTVTDDGKPNPPGTVTTAWSEIGGPGPVTFGNSNALATTASFSVAGTYQLQLAANDGQATTVGNIAVNAIKPALSLSLFFNAWQLSWPTNSINWLLQYQTNPPSEGLGTNWMDVPGPLTNPFAMPIYPGVGSAFYRLVLTNQ
jgi:beta-galactosidase